MNRALGAAATALGLLAAVSTASAEKITLKEGVYAKLETSKGNMIVELFEKKTPKTVKNFVDLAEGKKPWKDPKTGKMQKDKPLYDGTIFHRIVRGFMAQGGDPSGTGRGDVGFTIPMEKPRDLLHDRAGRVAMARKTDPNSASSQFYITFRETPFLDRPPGYAVFGQVIHGLRTVRELERTEVDPMSPGRSRPVKPVVLKKVSILRVEKDKTLELDFVDVVVSPEAGGPAGKAPTPRKTLPRSYIDLRPGGKKNETTYK